MSTGKSDAVGPSYYRLTVKAIHEETSDAKSFVLSPERGDESLFQYSSGQFLSFRIPYQDRTIIRSYSISSAPSADPELRICVKRVADGRGSNWFNDHLSVGARVEATLPSGRFVLRDSGAPLLLIAGGSGITPCISLLKQASLETERRIKLIYANRNIDSVIYRDELIRLQHQFAGRLECEYLLDDVDGFLAPDTIKSMTREWEDADTYICGPAPLMDMAEVTLGQCFGDKGFISTERFISPDDDKLDIEVASEVRIHPTFIDDFRLTLDGLNHTIPYAQGLTLMQAALAAGIDAPVSCAEGHCGTCMGALKSGKVEMTSTKALSKRNIERGYILACQSRPTTTEPLWLDFDL